MTESLAVYEVQLPDRQEVIDKLKAVQSFQSLIQKSLTEGRDFGTVTGIKQPFLFKAGAEKIAKLMGLADHYEIMDKEVDWDDGLFSYEVKCQLIDMRSGVIVSEGIGECNSYESKYRYRWVYANQLEDMGIGQEERHLLPFRSFRNGGGQYRIDNDDRAGLKNTILKMAKKRAMVDASLSAGRLSDLFTQDIEDMTIEGDYREVETPKTAPVVDNAATRKANSQVPLQPPFKDVGQFLTAANGRFGITRAQVLDTLDLADAKSIDFTSDKDWNVLIEVYAGPPSEGGSTDDGPTQATIPLGEEEPKANLEGQ